MSDKPKNIKPSQLIVEYPEKLIGQEIVFRLRKGGKILNFGTIKNIRKEGNEVRLEFDPDKPGFGKYAPRGGKNKPG